MHRENSYRFGFRVAPLLVSALAGGGLFAAACGGSTDNALGGSSDGGLVGDGSNGRRDGAASTSDGGGKDGGAEIVEIGGRNFVARKLYLGDSDRSGVQGSTAWEAYGANVDGLVTTADSTGVCALSVGATKSTQADGNDGIDNSFGANIVPIILAVAGSDFATKLNAGIEQGGSTFMLDFTGLTDDPAQTLSPLSAQLFGGAHFGTPSWTTTDRWSVYKSTLIGGSLATGAKTKFATAAISSGTWASGSGGDLPLSVSLGTATLALVIHHAVISFAHSSANQATLGNVSGVLTTSEFIAAFRSVAGTLSTQLCTGSSFDDIAAQFQAASDIMHDGTNTAAAACDAISIGIGFDATETAPPDTAIDLPVSPDPCSD